MDYVDKYVRNFKYNIENYPAEISKKKNSDIRKLVYQSNNEDKRVAIEIAWKIVYKD